MVTLVKKTLFFENGTEWFTVLCLMDPSNSLRRKSCCFLEKGSVHCTFLWLSWLPFKNC